MFETKLAFILGFLALVPQYYQIIKTEDINSFSLISVILSVSSFCVWTYVNIKHNNDIYHILDSLVNLSFYLVIMIFMVLQRSGHRKKGIARDEDRWIKEKIIKKLF